MIARIQGNVIATNERGVVIDVQGVGYKVSTVPQTALASAVGKPLTLWTHTAVREDAIELFGFPTQEELGMFELLISISGVGPRSALNILALVDPGTLIRAVLAQDASYLTRVSGIGKKTAQKIILELKDSVGHGETSIPEDLKEDADVVEALCALGYTQTQAREAVKKIPEETTGTGSRVKAALKVLSR